MHLCYMYVDERACENEKIQKEEKMSKISLYNIHILQICYVLSISFLLLQKLLSLKHTHTHMQEKRVKHFCWYLPYNVYWEQCYVGIRKSIVFAKRKFSSLVLNIFHIFIQMYATVSCCRVKITESAKIKRNKFLLNLKLIVKFKI